MSMRPCFMLVYHNTWTLSDSEDKSTCSAHKPAHSREHTTTQQLHTHDVLTCLHGLQAAGPACNTAQVPLVWLTEHAQLRAA